MLSGAFAGFIHGTVNFAIVEPYLDQAIGIENQNLFASGEEEDTPEFWVEYEGYRVWQKSGQILAGVILGISVGALFAQQITINHIGTSIRLLKNGFGDNGLPQHFSRNQPGFNISNPVIKFQF